MDKLKESLRARREEFDLDTPDESVWQRIAQPEKKPATIRMIHIWRYAAAACIALMIAGGIFFFSKKDQSVTVADLPVKHTTPVIAIDTVEKKHIEPADIPEKIDPPIVKPEIAKVQKQQPVQKVKKEISPTEQMMNNLNESYGTLISSQVKQINTTHLYAESPDYFSTFKNRLNQLNTDENNIKMQIKANGMSDALLQQFIDVNQQKLNVLKTLQYEINKMNKHVQPGQSGADGNKKTFIHI